MIEAKFFINGRFIERKAPSYEVISPIDGRIIGNTSDASEADVEHAVASAKKAFYSGWGTSDKSYRKELLLKWADAIEQNTERFLTTIPFETGTTHDEGWVQHQANIVRNYAHLMDQLGDQDLSPGPGMSNVVQQVPLGVVAAMVAWNNNLHGAVLKVGAALAAGNTVVIRCPEDAPLGVLALGHTIDQAGFPPGVVNLIAGKGPTTGIALVNHPDVRMISFTGSVGVGKKIMASAADSMKRVILELGGKSPFILFDDADMEEAIPTLVDCAYGFQGQACCAASRLLVQRSCLDEVVDRMRALAEAYQPAYPQDEVSPAFGPLFHEKQYIQTQKYVDIGLKEGTLLWGGERVTDGKFADGYYYKPTAFLLPDEKGQLAREEVFGPVLAVIPFDNEDDAIRIANDTPMGLSGSVWSQDEGRLTRVSNACEFGTVWCNCYYQFSPNSPWGGFKESGIGRESGLLGIQAFLEPKSIWKRR